MITKISAWSQRYQHDHKDISMITKISAWSQRYQHDHKDISMSFNSTSNTQGLKNVIWLLMTFMKTLQKTWISCTSVIFIFRHDIGALKSCDLFLTCLMSSKLYLYSFFIYVPFFVINFDSKNGETVSLKIIIFPWKFKNYCFSKIISYWCLIVFFEEQGTSKKCPYCLLG